MGATVEEPAGAGGEVRAGTLAGVTGRQTRRGDGRRATGTRGPGDGRVQRRGRARFLVAPRMWGALRRKRRRQYRVGLRASPPPRPVVAAGAADVPAGAPARRRRPLRTRGWP